MYWSGGYWWWPAPDGIPYVYVNNNYYPYENGAVVVNPPEVQTPPQNISPSEEGAKGFDSPDGRRAVQISGPQAEALLYDKSGGQMVFLKYLGQGVNKVRFSGGKNGKALKILVDFQDGGFAFFTADGDPMDAAPTLTPSDEPSGGAAPDSLPPMPPSEPAGRRVSRRPLTIA